MVGRRDAVVTKAHGFVENGLEVLGIDRSYNLLLECFEHFSFLGVFFYHDLVLGDDAAFLCRIDADGDDGKSRWLRLVCPCRRVSWLCSAAGVIVRARWP